jgi:HlyD family secretion protein
MRRSILVGLAALAAVAVAVAVVWLGREEPVPAGFAVGNGRLEAEEIHVATKLPGRVEEMLVDEGDRVEADQVVARMDAATLRAELRSAEAAIAKAREARHAAQALLAQRESECALARTQLRRIEALHEQRVASQEQVDVQRTRKETAEAGCEAARAQVADAEAAIDAARAQAERIRADLEDMVLEAPRAGRVQYRLTEPGEVIPAGGRVVTLLDLSDVTMTVFLPNAEAGRVRMGAEARVRLDALPERPLPARVVFVASEAEFTPKQVETREERQNLSFRVKVRLTDGEDALVKPGMPGVAWIRLDPDAAWPDRLR